MLSICQAIPALPSLSLRRRPYRSSSWAANSHGVEIINSTISPDLSPLSSSPSSSGASAGSSNRISTTCGNQSLAAATSADDNDTKQKAALSVCCYAVSAAAAAARLSPFSSPTSSCNSPGSLASSARLSPPSPSSNRSSDWSHQYNNIIDVSEGQKNILASLFGQLQSGSLIVEDSSATPSSRGVAAEATTTITSDSSNMIRLADSFTSLSCSSVDNNLNNNNSSPSSFTTISSSTTENVHLLCSCRATTTTMLSAAAAARDEKGGYLHSPLSSCTISPTISWGDDSHHSAQNSTCFDYPLYKSMEDMPIDIPESPPPPPPSPSHLCIPFSTSASLESNLSSLFDSIDISSLATPCPAANSSPSFHSSLPKSLVAAALSSFFENISSQPIGTKTATTSNLPTNNKFNNSSLPSFPDRSSIPQFSTNHSTFNPSSSPHFQGRCSLPAIPSINMSHTEVGTAMAEAVGVDDSLPIISGSICNFIGSSSCSTNTFSATTSQSSLVSACQLLSPSSVRSSSFLEAKDDSKFDESQPDTTNNDPLRYLLPTNSVADSSSSSPSSFSADVSFSSVCTPARNHSSSLLLLPIETRRQRPISSLCNDEGVEEVPTFIEGKEKRCPATTDISNVVDDVFEYSRHRNSYADEEDSEEVSRVVTFSNPLVEQIFEYPAAEYEDEDADDSGFSCCSEATPKSSSVALSPFNLCTSLEGHLEEDEDNDDCFQTDSKSLLLPIPSRRYDINEEEVFVEQQQQQPSTKEEKDFSTLARLKKSDSLNIICQRAHFSVYDDDNGVGSDWNSCSSCGKEEEAQTNNTAQGCGDSDDTEKSSNRLNCRFKRGDQSCRHRPLNVHNTLRSVDERNFHISINNQIRGEKSQRRATSFSVLDIPFHSSSSRFMLSEVEDEGDYSLHSSPPSSHSFFSSMSVFPKKLKTLQSNELSSSAQVSYASLDICPMCSLRFDLSGLISKKMLSFQVSDGLEDEGQEEAAAAERNEDEEESITLKKTEKKECHQIEEISQTLVTPPGVVGGVCDDVRTATLSVPPPPLSCSPVVVPWSNETSSSSSSNTNIPDYTSIIFHPLMLAAARPVDETTLTNLHRSSPPRADASINESDDDLEWLEEAAVEVAFLTSLQLGNLLQELCQTVAAMFNINDDDVYDDGVNRIESRIQKSKPIWAEGGLKSLVALGISSLCRLASMTTITTTTSNSSITTDDDSIDFAKSEDTELLYVDVPSTIASAYSDVFQIQQNSSTSYTSTAAFRNSRNIREWRTIHCFGAGDAQRGGSRGLDDNSSSKNDASVVDDTATVEELTLSLLFTPPVSPDFSSWFLSPMSNHTTTEGEGDINNTHNKRELSFHLPLFSTGSDETSVLPPFFDHLLLHSSSSLAGSSDFFPPSPTTSSHFCDSIPYAPRHSGTHDNDGLDVFPLHHLPIPPNGTHQFEAGDEYFGDGEFFSDEQIDEVMSQLKTGRKGGEYLSPPTATSKIKNSHI